MIGEWGHVYFLKNNGLIKVGMSHNLKARIQSFTTLLAGEQELLFTIRSNDPKRLEEEYHETYGRWRKNGEWFEMSEDTLHSINDTMKVEFCNDSLKGDRIVTTRTYRPPEEYDE